MVSTDLSIADYFPFNQVKIVRQEVNKEEQWAKIYLEPGENKVLCCSICGEEVHTGIHSWTTRSIRDLNLTDYKVWLVVRYRKLFCPRCNKVRVERLNFVQPYSRVTWRLARYIYDLCQHLSLKQVAEHFDLDWKTVKEIDKYFLGIEFGRTDYSNLRILAIDEVALRKGHSYLTVILDWEIGRVVWVGKNRNKRTLNSFFKRMPKKTRDKIEAVAMDMWPAFIDRVKHWCSQARIVFDLFHLVKDFNWVIDRVRKSEFAKATAKGKELLKDSKYLLLRNWEKVRGNNRSWLEDILQMNKPLWEAYILKELLKQIWSYRSRAWAEQALSSWYGLAVEHPHPAVRTFAKKILSHAEGILNHCDYPVNTSRLEGINNKIKVIKRRAYGFHDSDYFILKIKQAFPGKAMA